MKRNPARLRAHLSAGLPFFNLPGSRSITVALALTAFGLPMLVSPGANAQQQLSLKAQAAFEKQMLALKSEKASRTPAQLKLDSQFVYALRERKQGLAVTDVPQMKAKVEADGEDRVLVDLKGTITPVLLNEIKRLGGEVINSHPESDAARVRIGLGQMETLAARADVKFIGPAQVPQTNATAGQGVRTHRSDFVQSTYNILGGTTKVNGTGIKVGVISDTNDFLEFAQAAGDLPMNVTTLPGQSGRPGPGEGTAMMEIVNEMAPGAQLYYATAKGGAAQFAANIRALRDAGCRVIVDDISYGNEAPFQDDVISKAVNEVCADGVLFFSSATNSGNKNDGTSSTWEGDFSALGSIPGVGPTHNWGGSNHNKYTVADPGGDSVYLFWADPLGASNNDYDLFVVNDAGTILRSSTNPQTGSQDPIEFVSTISVGENVVVAKVSGASRFLHLEVGRGQIQYSTQGRTRGHNAAVAANAFSVAASDVVNSPSPAVFTGGSTNPVEPFSSDGPRRMFFTPNGTALTPGNFSATGGVVYNKPDITAADGVANSGAYASNLSPFFGTSAAAPHAAAIAALLWSYNPTLTPAQIRSALQDTALDIEAPGYDRDSGYGLVMADRALKQVMFQSDTLAPTGTIGSPLAGTITVPTNLVFSGTATDNQQLMSLMSYLKRNSDGKYWNGSGWQSADFSLPGSYNATNGNWGCTAVLPPVGGSSPNALLNGSYTFFIKLEDAAGRTAEVQSVVTVQLAGPAVAITTPAHNSFISGFTAISGTATDSGPGIAGNTVNLTLYQVSTGKYWNGTAWSSSSASLSVPVTAGAWNYSGTLPTNSGNSLAGQYTLSASTYDNNGTASPAVAGVNNIQFTVDTTPPVASITAPVNGSTLTTYNYQFAGGATDNKEVNRVVLFIRRNSDNLYWDGGAWISESLSANLSSSYNAATDTWVCNDTLPVPGNTLGNGSYNFIALAFDDAGNTHQADSVVTVDYHQIYNWTAGSYSDSDPGNNNLNWGNPANWSPNGVPAFEDIVYIDRNEAVFSTVNRTVYGFNMSTGAVYFTNGTDSLTIRKNGSWTGGGLYNSVYIESAATFALSGGATKGLAGGSVIHNSGNVTWTGPGLLQGNSGSVWNNKPGSSFTVLTDGDLFSNYNSGNTFNNEAGATFVKSAGSGELVIDEWTFNNAGTIQGQQGVVRFNTPLNLSAGSSFAGTGRILLNNATNLTGALTSTGNPELVGGYLAATAGTFSGTNPFIWSKGELYGTFTLLAGSVLDMTTGDTKFMGGGAAFNNLGRVNWHAGLLQGNNGSVFNNESGGIFDMKTDGDVFSNYNSGNTFNNKAGGLFIKSGKSAAPDGETYLDEWNFNNYGTIRSDTGVMRFHLPLWLYGGGTISRNGSVAAKVRSSHYFVLVGTTTVSNITLETTGDWHGNLEPGTSGNGTIATQSGGVFEWTGGTAHNTVNIAAGSTFSITGTGAKWIGGGGFLNNSGNATWTGTGALQGWGGSTFVNLSGSSFTAASDADWINYNTGNRFSNRAGATFSKTGGTENNRSDWAFDNNGQLTVSSGALAMNSGGSSSGTFTATGTGLVQFTGGSHSLLTTAKFEGTGKTQFLGGDAVAMNAINVGSTATTLEIAGGTVTSVEGASFNAIGTVNWTSGVIGGRFNLTAGSSMSLSSGATKLIAGGSAIHNSGAVTWTGPGLLQGNNGSVWNNKPGSSFTALTDGDVFSNNNSGNTFNNEAGATFAKSAGSGELVIDEWTFNNSGTIQGQQGAVRFNTALNLSAGSSFSGAGRILMNSATTLTGALTSTGNPELVGGYLAATAGTFSGTNPFVWSRGELHGAFTLLAGSVLNMTTGDTKFMGGGTTFNNLGRVNWQAGLLQGNNGSVFNNESGGIFDMKTDGDVFSNYNSGNTFNNKAGSLFIKSGKSAAPDGETYLDEWNFNNYGTIRSDTGVMRFHLPLWLYGGGTISRNGSVAAKVRSSHYFVLVGTTTVSNITLETTGDWHGNLEPGTSGNGTIATQSGGVFEWTGGTAHNTVNIAAGSTFSLAGPELKWIGGGGVLNNGGTATRTGTGALVGWGGSALVNLPGGVFNVSTSAPFTNYNGGNRFTNSGTLNVGTGAMISPMHWSFTQTGTGKINVEIGGTVAATPDYDQLNISGDAVLAGSIGVTLVNGFAPVANAEFPVVTFGGGRTGTFGSVTATGSTWALKHDPNSVSVVAKTKPTNFAAWVSYHFVNPASNDALASADPDKDGLSNIVEYGFGLNPLVGNVSPTVAGIVDISGSRYLTLTYTRPAGPAALTDISYAGERSPGMVTNTWSGAGVITHSTTMLPSGEEERVVLRSTQAISGAAKDFIRAKLVVTPVN